MLATSIAVIATVVWILGLSLPLFPVGAVLGLALLWTAATGWRLTRPWIAVNIEVFINLVIDSIFLTALLYLTGGATNPFVSLYLVPIVIAAAAMPAAFAWATVLVCVLFYSWLMVFFVPLAQTTRFGGDFNLHITGMWVNFIFSAALCAGFIAAVAGMIRRRDDVLAKAREDALRDEQIIALGTLAASVAHEMGTPLATMSLITEELEERDSMDPDYVRSIDTLKRQIETCRVRLRSMVDAMPGKDGAELSRITLRTFLDNTVDAWHIVRPEIEVRLDYNEPFFDPEISDERTVALALANLLDNAADASLHNGRRDIQVNVSSTTQRLSICIDDEGAGITADQLRLAEHALYSTKKDGLGIGILLSNASIERFGGDVILTKRAGGGTRTEIHLPQSSLAGRAD